MAKTKAKGSAKRSARSKKQITIEFPGAPPTAAQKKQIEELMGLVELGILALSQGVSISRQCIQKRQRKR